MESEIPTHASKELAIAQNQTPEKENENNGKAKEDDKDEIPMPNDSEEEGEQKFVITHHSPEQSDSKARESLIDMDKELSFDSPDKLKEDVKQEKPDESPA